MSRQSSGMIGDWAEAQRRQQRTQLIQQREAERRRRAWDRDVARGEREQQAAYRQRRDDEARRRTESIEAEVATLQNLLVAGCGAAAFRMASLVRDEELEPFRPGSLAHPVAMPHIEQFLQQSSGMALGSYRRAQAEREAQAQHARAHQKAKAAETRRQQQLAEHRQQYDRWATEQLAGIRAHNRGLSELAGRLRAGEAEAVVEYFSAALYASTAWPEELPRQVSAAYDQAPRQLVLDWELPPYGVVPEAKSVRYLPSTDQDKETVRPVTQRRALYRDLLAQCVLLVVRELYAADEFGALDSVVVNGFVDDHDPATGREAHIVLATVSAERSAFEGLRLEQVSAVECLVEGLRGQLSARPDQLTAVRPGRRPDEVGGDVVSHGGHAGDEDEPDLFAMDPIAFENLVAELFRAMGMEAVTTQRSGDGGVDVEAVDPAPIRGGRIVVQVKRYRNTVPPTAVRDLYGTVQDKGANKGVLVTTASFGPGSYTFANGKPLELVPGADLVDLLHQYGLRGRLGGAPTAPSAAPAPAPRATPDAAPAATARRTPEPAPPADHNVLGMSWSGSVALDVCALVCEGGRVLSEEHFVFYNNPRTPDGSVRARTHPAPDRAALEVSFDALPEPADRLVLVAAIDPEVDPHADLAGFTDAHIRLLSAGGEELGRLDVSDGRAGETALVLGSFRRRSNGDWDFVIGGKGYRGGLEVLLGEYGVEVA
ncbi:MULTISPECIES: restriction endonuclease [unclassified Streptomyces]|uniref:restriction endonuclease n=1 Tax=unclassified Streptomyces TaxID=2593676 RepID=UPI002258EC75|nr:MULTISPECIES: restriction endonuclease [unclassified Streptomyces]MCX4528558.1 restriction endonuclease [Streptomyces sp. NBC_01551]MCX4540844.1 restriction endonuclease [Streptomyces sp. NBC_01565]